MGDFSIVSGDTFSIIAEEESDKIIMDSWPDGFVLCEVTKKRTAGVGFCQNDSPNCHEIQFKMLKVVKPKVKKRAGKKK
jgi:hypothetical protein